MNAIFQELARRGVTFEGARDLMPAEWFNGGRHIDSQAALDSYAAHMAMDAQPGLATSANAGIPAILNTLIDPEVIEILFAPNKFAKILGNEVRKGDWADDTMMFKLVEQVGEVTSYGDYAASGRVDANVNFPQRQSYLYQTILQLGDRELARYGRAGLDWANQKRKSAVMLLDKFQNLSYAFGIAGLANYGLLNDPSLLPSLTPSPKSQGGVKWISNGVMNAQANEVFNDIQSMFVELANQSDGLIDVDSKIVLAMSPQSEMALSATNIYNYNVRDMVLKNFPNVRFESAIQYATPAGQLVQMICEEIDGEETAFPAYNEKLRAHRMIYEMSSYKQKLSQGSWGTIIRRPFAISSMLGV